MSSPRVVQSASWHIRELSSYANTNPRKLTNHTYPPTCSFSQQLYHASAFCHTRIPICPHFTRCRKNTFLLHLRNFLTFFWLKSLRLDVRNRTWNFTHSVEPNSTTVYVIARLSETNRPMLLPNRRFLNGHTKTVYSSTVVRVNLQRLKNYF